MRSVAVLLCGAVLLACDRPAPQASSEALWLESRDARLSATLHLPPRQGPHPAVVLVHGSGRLTGGDVAGAALAPLRRMGFAVLAYDKRGVGRSTGVYSGIGPANSTEMFDLLASDALAAVHALRARRDIDPRRVGLLGYSQGGWIAPLAASRDPGVAFMISLSGPSVTVGEENAYSRLAGADPGSEQGLSEEEIARRFEAFSGPHGYDPRPVIAAMRAPSLWVFGELDRSIPVPRSVEYLEHIKRERAAPITLRVLPGLDHGLHPQPSGPPSPHWEIVRDWLSSQGLLDEPGR